MLASYRVNEENYSEQSKEARFFYDYFKTVINGESETGSFITSQSNPNTESISSDVITSSGEPCLINLPLRSANI